MKEKYTKEINSKLWKSGTYSAYENKYGAPEDASKRILKNPDKILYPIREYFGDVQGKKIANLMGSIGQKSVALSLLGAEVTIFDLSESNKDYAELLFAESGVVIDYVVSDVLAIDIEFYNQKFDIVFAEMGILHYFTDLNPFFEVAYKLLSENGVFIIRDFHPVSTKLISSKGSTAKVRKHKVDGDYFSTELMPHPIAYSKYSNETEFEQVLLRKWTLGEIITSIAKIGFKVEILREEANLSSEVYDKGIPKTFTLVCRKV